MEHGGNIYKLRGRKILDFSANINPLGLSPKIKKWLDNQKEVQERILHYPDPETRELKKVIARYWEIKEDNILIANGSTELIYLLPHICKSSTFIVQPTFSEWEKAFALQGRKTLTVPLSKEDNFTLQNDELNTLPEDSSLIICNPNNPTGNLLVEDPKKFLSSVKFSHLTVDETFMDFLPQEKRLTFLYEALTNDKVLVLRTFTKFFALPGLRIGYLVGSRANVEKLQKLKPPWSVNMLAQETALRALEDKDYIRKTREYVLKEKDFLFSELSKIKGLKPYPTRVNFIFLEITRKELTSEKLQKLLLEEGILIRDCSNFNNLNHKFFRVAVRNHEENLYLLKSIKKIFLQ